MTANRRFSGPGNLWEFQRQCHFLEAQYDFGWAAELFVPRGTVIGKTRQDD